MPTDKDILRILVSNQFADFFEDGVTLENLKRRNDVKHIIVAFLNSTFDLSVTELLGITRDLLRYGEFETRAYLRPVLERFNVYAYNDLRVFFLDGPAGSFSASVIARAVNFPVPREWS